MRKSPLAKGVGVRCMLHVGYGTQGTGKPRGCSGRRRFCWRSACPAAWLCGRARQGKPQLVLRPRAGAYATARGRAVCLHPRLRRLYIDDRPEHTAADGADKVVYLTFDAGYENGSVARVLDALAEADAAGAFFVLGNRRGRIPTLSAGWRRRDIGMQSFVCAPGYDFVERR